MQIRGKKVLVIGAAVTGIPTVEQLSKLGAHVTLNDKKTKEEIMEMLRGASLSNIKIVGFLIIFVKYCKIPRFLIVKNLTFNINVISKCLMSIEMIRCYVKYC